MKLLAATILIANAILAQHSRFGLPACHGSSSELADREFFILCHDALRLVASWTAYEILPGRMGGNAQRPRRFRADHALVGPVAHDADYRNSGYARGHSAPAEDLAFSSASIRSTFVLSNAMPQLPSVNRGNWRRVENAVRAVAAKSDAVYVFTGPLFPSTSIEFVGRVAIPTHFYKVWLALRGSEKRMYATIVPNAAVCAETLEAFAVSVDEVEHRSGLDFFGELEDEEEQRLESEIGRMPSRLRRGACAVARAGLAER